MPNYIALAFGFLLFKFHQGSEIANYKFKGRVNPNFLNIHDGKGDSTNFVHILQFTFVVFLKDPKIL